VSTHYHDFDNVGPYWLKMISYYQNVDVDMDCSGWTDGDPPQIFCAYRLTVDVRYQKELPTPYQIPWGYSQEEWEDSCHAEDDVSWGMQIYDG
jgi:hypothetical protein